MYAPRTVQSIQWNGEAYPVSLVADQTQHRRVGSGHRAGLEVAHGDRAVERGRGRKPVHAVFELLDRSFLLCHTGLGPL